jgi:hypothetical protein
MGIDAGPILFALMLGVLLAAGVAWFVAGLYQRRMVTLMGAGPAPDDRHAVGEPPAVVAPPRPPPVLDAAANRRQMGRQLLAWSLLCLVIGFSHSWLALRFVYTGDGFSATRLLVLGLVYAWPMVMAWGLLRRWPWGRVVLGVGVYMVAMAAVVMFTSDDDQTLAGVAAWLGGVVAIPVVITLLIGASGRIRAVAPYLLPVFVLLAASSVYALNVLAGAVEHEPDWLAVLLGTVGAWGTLLLVVLAPWLVLAWPVYALARWLAGAYRRKRFSDLGYLFAAYWMVILVASALPGLQAVGAASLTQLLPWLWIPLAAVALRGWLAPPGSPPTLLVLRVFQQDARVQALFDRVVERWRLSGNTVLIAGTDLVSRTLDPDDLFTFINGRLGEPLHRRRGRAGRTPARVRPRPGPRRPIPGERVLLLRQHLAGRAGGAGARGRRGTDGSARVPARQPGLPARTGGAVRRRPPAARGAASRRAHRPSRGRGRHGGRPGGALRVDRGRASGPRPLGRGAPGAVRCAGAQRLRLT